MGRLGAARAHGRGVEDLRGPAWVASFDRHLAATGLVLREFTVVVVAYLFIGRAAPWRSFWLSAGLSAVGRGTCWLVVL